MVPYVARKSLLGDSDFIEKLSLNQKHLAIKDKESLCTAGGFEGKDDKEAGNPERQSQRKSWMLGPEHSASSCVFNKEQWWTAKEDGFLYGLC